MQSAEIGSTAHTLLQGLSTSVMGGRADVMSKIKIATRKANSVAKCTFAPPADGHDCGAGLLVGERDHDTVSEKPRSADARVIVWISE